MTQPEHQPESQPDDQPDDQPEPTASHRPRAGWSGLVPGLGRVRAAVGERVRGRDTDRRTATFVGDSERVEIDVRCHPLLLLTPALRTLAGLVAVTGGLRLWPLLAFALLTGSWATSQFRLGLRRTARVAGAVTVALVLLTLVLGPGWLVVGLLAWAAADVADWYRDRLVVTDKRIYRRYGVITEHAPSISLNGIAYLDASVPPLGRLLAGLGCTPYGTLSLDSAAQRDAPLSRFDYIPDVVRRSHEILDLRTEAMRRFPQPPR